MTTYRYPFGRPVTPRPPSATGPRQTFVLGAYPSALHAAWEPEPTAAAACGVEGIRAIAVDDEPTRFWTGHDEVDRIEAWRELVGFDKRWGTVKKVGHLNGASGLWVAERVLQPLGLSDADVWMTDCLDTYRCSNSLWTRIGNSYVPFAAAMGLPATELARHPSENELVREAVELHTKRLVAELAEARPERIVTLGNAALRVLATIVEGDALPDQLSVVGERYARPQRVRFEGRPIEWLPLTHPAAPQVYQDVHRRWVAAVAKD